jgi:hypothetical protein
MTSSDSELLQQVVSQIQALREDQLKLSMQVFETLRRSIHATYTVACG